MNMTVVRLSAAALVLMACGACSKESSVPVTPAKPPEKAPPAVRKPELLAKPEGGNVFTATQKAADFPELKITTLKPGEGEDTLGMGQIGSFHLVGKLANLKEFKNTHNAGAPEDIVMMEWGALRGVILGTVGMKKGEIRNLRIPADLAYGAAGDPGLRVQPNATVFVRAELVEIKPGLETGFEVIRVKEGSGPAIRKGQKGRFDYTGIFAEGDHAGDQFDSSRKPGASPLEMTVGEGALIEGWLKGALGMRLGEKRWLRIPADLAYGDEGRSAPPPHISIPPKSTLIFELELVSM